MDKISQEVIAKEFEELQRITAACLKNAEDMVKSAKILLDQNVDHICYHLAALALEEVGKISLLRVKFGAFSTGKLETFTTPVLDDHIKKLFWAIWAPLFGQATISREQFDFCKGLASKIHNTRVRSLYVDPSDPLMPEIKLGHDEVEQLVTFAEARVGMQAEEGEHIFDEESAEIGSWFIDANDDPEMRGFIFGSESMNKLTELKNPRKWIEWLREQSIEFEKQARSLLEKELNRPPVSEEEGVEKRWKIKLRLYSASHSIRPKVLNKWNEVSTHIFLYPTNKKDELICEFNLLKQLPMKDLWNGIWEASRLFVISLNVATQGFFWWYLPREINSLFDEIVDLENKRNAKIEDTHKFKDNWQHLVFKENLILPIRYAMVYLLRIRGTDEEQAFFHYTMGLTVLAKSDPQFNFYINAYLEFYRAFLVGLYVNKHWDGKEEIKIAARRGFIDENEEVTGLDDLLDLGGALEQGKRFEEVTTKEIIEMKNVFDAYIVIRILEKIKGIKNLVEVLKPIS